MFNVPHINRSFCIICLQLLLKRISLDVSSPPKMANFVFYLFSIFFFQICYLSIQNLYKISTKCNFMGKFNVIFHFISKLSNYFTFLQIIFFFILEYSIFGKRKSQKNSLKTKITKRRSPRRPIWFMTVDIRKCLHPSFRQKI